MSTLCRALTFVFAQEVDAFLQDGGLVHLPGVARQHRAEFLDEDIELVSPLLLRLVTGHATIETTVIHSIKNVKILTNRKNNLKINCYKLFYI